MPASGRLEYAPGYIAQTSEAIASASSIAISLVALARER